MKDKTGWNKYRRKASVPTKKQPTVDITGLANSGEGIARIDNHVVFIPYTMPGDTVKIEIVQQKKNFARARVISIDKPSDQRVEPACEYFKHCGGCDWQHIPYAVQLQEKRHQLEDALRRIGRLATCNIKPIVPSADPYHYRNRIQGEVQGGQFYFMQRASHTPIAIKHCAIAEPAINHYLSAELKSAEDGSVEIAVTNGTASIHAIKQSRSEELGFRQVNTQVSELLLSQLIEKVSQSQAAQIVDLYCGKGAWTNQLANKLHDRQIIGVDVSKANIQYATDEAKRFNLHNVRFHLAKVEHAIKTLQAEGSVCIVDPPRNGLSATVVEHLIKHPPKELIYVSCHPATLARDLSQLCQSVFMLDSIQPFDMFPQTAHLECLCVLRRQN